MDDSTKVLLLSTLITVFGSAITILITKWAEIKQHRANANDQTKGELALAKFGQEETIRQEMQKKIDRMERMLDRHERVFGQMRDMVADVMREVLISLQLAIHDIKAARYVEAETKISDSIDKIKSFKVPSLQPMEEQEEK